MALLVLALVAIVVAQTSFDWRDTKKAWSVPAWGKGIALGGLIAVSLAASSAFASVWMREEAGEWTGGFGSAHFWLELVFSFAMLAIVVYGLRKKRLRLMVFLGCALTAVFVLVMAL